jgi:beta-glucosidase
MITESGCAYSTAPDAWGVVDDQARIEYLDAHLRAVAVAVRAGVDVRGYYTSLLDKFEWAEGYTQPFGLVTVDHETKARVAKRSFDWYTETIKAQPPDN